MPWYKSGTVSVVQNNPTVTGTNTAFAANARVGDAFLGPDGRWYEVGNVASDTVISIVPPYQGPTAGAGVYALAPMQGYVKDSADQLRILVNKFGSLASSAAINALAAVTGVADRIAYFTAADTMAVTAFTGAARTLLAAATQAAQREAVGLGPTASLSIGAVEITAAVPFIDFHFNNTTTDYDVRLINSASGTLNAVVLNGNEFRINGSTAWNDAIAAAKLAAIGVGGIGSYAFCLTNTALTPGATTVGGNLQYAFAIGQGSSSPTGTWRCMGDTVAGGRTLFQRVS